MSADKTELHGIREELASISLALSILAVNQTGLEATNAAERRRHDEATQRGLELLVARMEEVAAGGKGAGANDDRD